ncbi:hypothetical protein KUV57_12810 [Epibacterium sp. DP7N7-1]|nr:hypothetical protein [Epibacterium sp. DP7N7-1]
MPEACHGPMTCRVCWKSSEGTEKDLHDGKWRLVNDPGYWGAPDPEVLVLGMTKGTTQAQEMSEAFQNGTFDTVAFGGFRQRLLEALQIVGMMQGVQDISPYLTAASLDWGFASIVRCSLTARDQNGSYRGNSGPVIRGMRSPEGAQIMSACVKEHLTRLGSRNRLVVLLGNDENYFRAIKQAMLSAFGSYDPLPGAGNTAFRAGGRLFVHIGHPSPLNGHFSTFRTGSPETGQGRKRVQARLGIEASEA